MRQFILLGVPDGFPCHLAALSSLPAAVEQRMDVIRVEKGHVCEFKVADLVAHVERAKALKEAPVPLSIMGTTSQLQSWGAAFEPRLQLWPGFSG